MLNLPNQQIVGVIHGGLAKTTRQSTESLIYKHMLICPSCRLFTLSRMSFGTELWDQVKAVEQYVENGNQYMDKVNDFLKNIVAAEQEYARALTKAAKPIKDEQIKRMNDKSKVVKTLLDSYLGANLAQITRRGSMFFPRSRTLPIATSKLPTLSRRTSERI